MKMQVAELEPEGYRPLAKMKHGEFMHFLTPYLNKANAATIAFASASIVLLLSAVLLCAVLIRLERSADCLLYLFGGCLAAYALIPVHEFIHAIAYRILGAPTVSYDVNF